MGNSGGDFVDKVGDDETEMIFRLLDDPADLVRASAVSKNWNWFIIGNSISRQLCLKMFPEMESVARALESNSMTEGHKYGLDSWKANETGLDYFLKVTGPGFDSWKAEELLDPQKFLKWKNAVYSFLARGLSPVIRNDCISVAISASSTDNYPIESIHNTLASGSSSYWSSRGEKSHEVPETLLYKLSSKLCVVSEIHIHPFRAYFQDGFPVYSCKAVRFRIGHVRDQAALESVLANNAYVAHDDRFIWNYTSPKFPVVQKSILQKFELPEPAICAGGFLLVELLGRDQRQDIDGLYYICIAYVQLVGRPLLPPFDVEVLGSGKYSLKYHPKTLSSESSLNSPIIEAGESSHLRTILTVLPRFVSNSLRAVISILPPFADEDESDDESP